MKKITLILLAIFLFAGCNTKKIEFSEEKSENTVLEVSESDTTEDKSGEKIRFCKIESVDPSRIDLDFTKMNYNMISSVLFDFLTESEKYVNKTVKIDGQFTTGVYEGVRYFAVINWDLAGCCPTGLDFIPSDSFNFPSDFPEEGDYVTVIGKMGMMTYNDTEQLYLLADKILK